MAAGVSAVPLRVNPVIDAPSRVLSYHTAPYLHAQGATFSGRDSGDATAPTGPYTTVTLLLTNNGHEPLRLPAMSFLGFLDSVPSEEGLFSDLLPLLSTLGT